MLRLYLRFLLAYCPNSFFWIKTHRHHHYLIS